MYDLVKPPDSSVPLTSVPTGLGVERGGAEVDCGPQALTKSSARTTNALRLDKLGKAVFEFSEADVDDLQRQLEIGRDLVGLVGESRIRNLP